MWSRGLRRNAVLGHELGDEHGGDVPWGIDVQRGHLRVEHELGDGHGGDVSGGIGVQRGHLRVGHGLGDEHGRYV